MRKLEAGALNLLLERRLIKKNEICKKGEGTGRYVVSPVRRKLEAGAPSLVKLSGGNRRKLGLSHMDFIIAAGLFLLVFALVVNMLTNFITAGELTADVNTLTGTSMSLLTVADYGFEPPGWNGSGPVDRIGIATRAFTFNIVINNTEQFRLNTSVNITDLTAERVTFNYTDLGHNSIDVNSTMVYDENGIAVAYNITGRQILFAASVNTNVSRVFAVYFDDDSNFTSRSAAVTSTDTLNETLLPIIPITVVQNRKMSILNASNYSSVKTSINISDFRLLIRDIDSKSDFWNFGGTPPRHGNVISLQRYVRFQNATAGIRNGRLTAQAW